MPNTLLYTMSFALRRGRLQSEEWFLDALRVDTRVASIIAVDGLPFVSSDQIEGLRGEEACWSRGRGKRRRRLYEKTPPHWLMIILSTRKKVHALHLAYVRVELTRKLFLRSRSITSIPWRTRSVMDNGVHADRFVTSRHHVRKILGGGGHGDEVAIGGQGKRRVCWEPF